MDGLDKLMDEWIRERKRGEMSHKKSPNLPSAKKVKIGFGK